MSEAASVEAANSLATDAVAPRDILDAGIYIATGIAVALALACLYCACACAGLFGSKRRRAQEPPSSAPSSSMQVVVRRNSLAPTAPPAYSPTRAEPVPPIIPSYASTKAAASAEQARREAAQRAAAYRANEAAARALPGADELEAGLGSGHAAIKPALPSFAQLSPGRREKSGAFVPGVVLAPARSPPTSARGAGEFGWGANAYILPEAGYNSEAELTPSRLSRFAMAARDMLWSTPVTRSAVPAITYQPETGKQSRKAKRTESYGRKPRALH